MKTLDDYPNLRLKPRNPQKNIMVTVDDGKKITQHQYIKRMLVELPYPFIEQMQELKNRGVGSTLNDLIRYALVKAGMVNAACVEDVPTAELATKKRYELSQMIPTVGPGQTKRQLVK
jgi:hypothetical protein